MKKGMLVLAAVVIALAPMSASAAIVRGGFVVGGPGIYGGWYSPYWGSYWGPGYASPYYAYPNSGQVKLDTKVKDAQVFINGSYAGTTHENKDTQRDYLLTMEMINVRTGEYDKQAAELSKGYHHSRVGRFWGIGPLQR